MQATLHAGIDPTTLRQRGGMATPYTRGSTLSQGLVEGSDEGYPVHAGIDPSRWLPALPHRRLPRTRGDRPQRTPQVGVRFSATPYTRGSTSIMAGGVSE